MRTLTNLLEALYHYGYTIEQLDQLIDPNLSNVLYTIRRNKGTLADLLAIIHANQLPGNFDMEHLEEKVENHYEI